MADELAVTPEGVNAMDALELGIGITSVTLLCAYTIAGPPAPVVTETVTASRRAADCDLRQRSVGRAEAGERAKLRGPMLIGIKNRETLLERELDLTRDGWMLKCQGLGVVSGRKNTPIYYGFQMKDGKAFVVHESQN